MLAPVLADLLIEPDAANPPQRALRIFIFYAHEDAGLRERFEKHLELLRRQGYIEVWHDQKLMPGSVVQTESAQALAAADVVVPLISSDLIASETWAREMDRALERRKEQGLEIVPVLLRPFDLQETALNRMTILPSNGQEVTAWQNEDLAWKDVAQGIRRIAKQWRSESSPERGQHVALLVQRPPAVALPATYQQFAQYMKRRIEQINSELDWSDAVFTELEAEVESEVSSRWFDRWLRPWKRRGLRRERSLSDALKNSTEPLILLDGEPGSGKSVALRHLGRELAQKAQTANKPEVIPIYIDLRKLRPGPGAVVDSSLIRSFVLSELGAVNVPALTSFLKEEFDRGIREGRWLFLFDGFDEIPAVLCSSEVDRTIVMYATALEGFTCTMARCRAIVASRPYRGPRKLGWPSFRILPLSENRRLEFLLRSCKSRPQAEQISDWLLTEGSRIGILRDNPLFLALLCNYVKRNSGLPRRVHDVYADFFSHRLGRDEQRVRQAYHLGPDELHRAAEGISYCMASHPELGLSPALPALSAALSTMELCRGMDLDDAVDALVELRLGSIERDALGSRRFGFAHRRFQEYFATSVALAHPELVEAGLLLRDPRWREPAVVLLQTQQGERFRDLTARATQLLEGWTVEEDPKAEPSIRPFPWPEGMLHVLGLLQDGLAGRIEDVPEALRIRVGAIISRVRTSGTLLDHKWALEVAGVAPQEVLLSEIQNAFRSPSAWLRDVAVRQTESLTEIPDSIHREIRGWLIRQMWAGRLIPELPAIRAQLARLPGKERYLPSLRVLKAVAVTSPLVLRLKLLICIVMIARQTSLFTQVLLTAFTGALWQSHKFSISASLFNKSNALNNWILKNTPQNPYTSAYAFEAILEILIFYEILFLSFEFSINQDSAIYLNELRLTSTTILIIVAIIGLWICGAHYAVETEKLTRYYSWLLHPFAGFLASLRVIGFLVSSIAAFILIFLLLFPIWIISTIATPIILTFWVINYCKDRILFNQF